MTTPNPREMVRKVLQGKDTPRPVCGPLAVHYCAGPLGVTVQEYSTNAQTLADAVVAYYEKFRPDAVWVSADTWVTAEAMGAKIRFSSPDHPPSGAGSALIHCREDIEAIPPVDVKSQARLPLMLEALGRVKEAVGEEVFVVACLDQSPFSLACALMDINTLMVKLMEEPEMVKALLERCLEYSVAYGEALAGAGADMLSTGDSPAVLLGPDFYRDYALPAEQKQFARLREKTDAFLSLHICGNASTILADMAQSGADVLEIDFETEWEKALETVPESLALWGNLEPVGLLAQGSPEQVREAALHRLELNRKHRRKNCVLSSGCTLAMETPEANLQALVESVKS